MSELDDIKARLSNRKAVKDLIYEVFYGGPMAHASQNLAEAIERYALGMPRLTKEEELREWLATLTPEARSEWWRQHNETLNG